eukprot:gene862-1076_t
MNRIEKIVKVFKGTIIHSKEITKVEILQNSLIGINEEGTISFIGAESDIKSLESQFNFEASKVVEDLGKKILIPGFIDTHAHAPQYHNSGTGTELPLLKWLEKYTFPVESQFKDLEFAKNVYTKVVNRTLRNGTTTCCYYATIHVPASLLLGNIVGEMGQRGFIGKVCMDRHSPEYYVETTANSIKDTEEFVSAIHSLKNPLVQPIITPRFAPSCTDELLHALGGIANRDKLMIQSHVSENKDEVAWVRSLYPHIETYTEVYKHHGLLNERSIMAHAVHLDDHEISLFKSTGAGIAHCPVSNFTISSGCLDVRRVLANEIKLGLGTDISGGYSPSILHVIRDTIKCSNSRFFNDDKHTPLTFEEAFYLATVGGSKVVGLEDKIGNFQVGKEFDAQVIDPFSTDSPFDVFQADTIKDIFQKFIFLGDDRNVNSVYVKGKQIKF